MPLLALLTIVPSPPPSEDLVSNASTLVDVLSTVGSLFTSFPINLFLVAGVIAIVFMIFRRGKNAVR